MPRVPIGRQVARNALADVQVTPANLLMAAAETHRLGRLIEPDDDAQPSLSIRGKPQTLRQRQAK